MSESESDCEELKVNFYCFVCGAKSTYEIEHIKKKNNRYYAQGHCDKCGSNAKSLVKKSVVELIKRSNANDENITY